MAVHIHITITKDIDQEALTTTVISMTNYGKVVIALTLALLLVTGLNVFSLFYTAQMNSKVNEFDSQLQKVGEQITSSNSKVNELKLQLQRVEKQLANLSEILQKLVMPINISSVFLR